MPINIPDPTTQLLTIPQVRGILRLLTIERQDPVFMEIEGHLYRRPHVRRARHKQSMSPRTALRIKELARDNPYASYQWIAERAAVSIGRVSEVLAGPRGDTSVQLEIPL